jgi:hypothetical protein
MLYKLVVKETVERLYGAEANSEKEARIKFENDEAQLMWDTDCTDSEIISVERFE